MKLRPLSDALRKKAEEEINEVPNMAETSVATLRDWLNQQPHLRTAKIPDQWLIAVLRGSKFNIKKAQDKLDMYYRLKNIAPEIAANRDPLNPAIQDILKIGFHLPLRKGPQEDSPRSCLTRIAAFNGTKHTLTDLIKVTLMIYEILMIEDDNFTICGVDFIKIKCNEAKRPSKKVSAEPIDSLIIGGTPLPLICNKAINIAISIERTRVCENIADAKDLGFGLVSQWTPTLAKKVITCLEKSLSVRLKSMHMLNVAKGLKAAIQIFKLFLGAKHKTRIRVYSKGYEKLYKTIDKSILPVEYGGTDGNVQTLIDYWKMKVESYRDWFVQQDNISLDDSDNPESKNSTNVLGIVKSFKNLDID